jgi:spore coat polysaccharide biosynthesis predicted glycosyltransferase SpsG
MRYVLRADASQTIGAGHVMRSSAIAEELINRGEQVIFVGQISGLPWVKERIASLGFYLIHNSPSEFISNPESDVLILDSYEIEVGNAFIASENWLHIIVMVDEQTPNYSCTLRIHPGLDSNWVGDSRVSILAGPNYIPFRSSLSKNMHYSSQGRYKLKIVVTAGGSDPYNLVLEIAVALAKIPEPFQVCLFSNSTSDVTLDSRFQYFEIGSGLEEISKDADLVFTTSSTSSLEFIARGLCVGMACAVANQRQYYDKLNQLGVAAQIGMHIPNFGWNLDVETIHMLVTSSQLREKLIAKAKGIIDFKGAIRIVDAIKNL